MNPSTFLDRVTLENLDRLPTVPVTGQLQGRRIKMNWKTARALAIAAVAAPTIALKVYNLTYWNLNSLDIAADVGLGVEASLLLPHLTSPEVYISIMNMIKKYSLEAVTVLIQFVLKTTWGAPPSVFKQIVYGSFNSLLGALATDNLMVAFAYKQEDSESDAPLPMLTGDAKNWKHLLISSAIKIIACAGLMIPRDEHKLCQAGGLFLGFHALGEALSYLITKAKDQEKQRIIQTGNPYEKPSCLIRVLNNFVTFDRLTHPIFIALANTIFPYFLPKYNIGIAYSGGAYGLTGHLAKVDFQYQERFQVIEEEVPPDDQHRFEYIEEHEENELFISRASRVNQAVYDSTSTSSSSVPLIHHNGEERPDEPSANQSATINHRAEDWTSSISDPPNGTSLSCFQRTWSRIKAGAQDVWNSAKATAAKVKNYVGLRIVLPVLLVCSLEALDFTVGKLAFNGPTESDIIALSIVGGSIILSFLFAEIISSTCAPSAPKRTLPPSESPESTLRRALDWIKDAAKNTLYHNTVDDQTAFIIFYLMLYSVNMGIDDTDFQNLPSHLFVAHIAELVCYGAAQGLKRVKIDRLNRFERVQVPPIVMSVLTEKLVTECLLQN